MARLIKDVSHKKGLSPGSAIFVGKKKIKNVTFDVIDYSEKEIFQKSFKSITEVQELVNKKSVTWINVNGLHDVSKIKKIGELFSLHSLVVEDIVNTNQRPKFEEHDKYNFIVLKMLHEESGRIHTEQLSIIFTDKYIISFQEKEGDSFNSIRNRIKEGNWRIRKLGCDYLAYALIDSVVDNYYTILTSMGDKSDEIETEVLGREDMLPLIQKLKSDIIYVKKAIFPMREILNGLIKTESILVKKETKLFIRDVNDHISQVLDTIESLKDSVSNSLDIYYTNTGNKMNEVMKVLTIIATIFIPLTFIAGIYGMNFDYMPELGLKWFYPTLWCFMIVIGISMFLFFKRRRWI